MCPKRRGTQPRTPARRVTSVVYSRCNIFERMFGRYDGPPRPFLSGVRVTEGHPRPLKVTAVCPCGVPVVSRLCPDLRHA